MFVTDPGILSTGLADKALDNLNSAGFTTILFDQVEAVPKEEISKIYGVNQVTSSRLPLALIPTTAGSGSEVTGVSIVTTDVNEKKG